MVCIGSRQRDAVALVAVVLHEVGRHQLLVAARCGDRRHRRFGRAALAFVEAAVGLFEVGRDHRLLAAVRAGHGRQRLVRRRAGALAVVRQVREVRGDKADGRAAARSLDEAVGRDRGHRVLHVRAGAFGAELREVHAARPWCVPPAEMVVTGSSTLCALPRWLGSCRAAGPSWARPA
jgi:hypothetical protein